MRVAELRGKRVAIWGYAREGRAALQFLRERDADLDLTVLEDAAAPEVDAPLVSGRAAIAAAMGGFDVVVKSPGISLYDPLVVQAKAQGVRFTSLLNLWFATEPACRTICVTGTKGKSTTTALIAHMLSGVGWRVMAAGNIGVPVTELPAAELDAAVIEVSSYQAADFCGLCDIAVLTSLSQEHLDWHGSLAAYKRDKLNLLRHARVAIVNGEADCSIDDAHRFDPRPPLNFGNRYLMRPHNLSNVAAALAVLRWLDVDTNAALRAAEGFQPLPHRQQEIGTVDGVLFVDDSISTTPEATIAALDVYSERAVTVIIGGHDRGIEYGLLLERLRAEPRPRVVLMDASGERIHRLLGGQADVRRADTMQQAVALAQAMTPPGGVVLLSPAAPSYGRYKSFIERGQDFARWALTR